MLYKDVETVNKLKIGNTPIDYTNIGCWYKQEKDYKCYIFTATFDNVEELEQRWNFLSNDIAVRFQSHLEKLIEVWNIYLAIFIRQRVTRELKYKIEQDKYSCRKIVFDQMPPELSEEYIVQMLRKKLFDFSLEHLVVNQKKEIALVDKLAQINSRFTRLLEETTEPADLFIKYIEEK